ncbi:MAG: cobalamin-dependent protein [Actinomycetota bacterium]|nr:cobalamin-dependent protein [Actinomycetota bacterium]
MKEIQAPGAEAGESCAEERLLLAISGLREEEALAAAEEMLAAGADPLRVVEAARRGMDEVGRRYQRHEYYLSGLIMSGEIFSEIGALVDRALQGTRARGSDLRVVMGTPLGDVHDIGKDIVCSLLRCSGFEVIDLGVNVAPWRFVEAAEKSGARVVGMSALITPAYEAMRETVWGFERAGCRERVRIMLGGGAVTGKVCEFAGADAWGREACDALEFARAFYGVASEAR